jgi:hypothetical protein
MRWVQGSTSGHAPDDMQIMSDAGSTGIPCPAGGLGGGAWGEIGFEKGVQTVGRIVGHLLQADAAGAGPAVLDLDGADHEDLALVAAPAAASQGIVLAAADDLGFIEYLFAARWPAGFICPACGGGKAWQLHTKAWTWECAHCGKQTSVTAGTIMHHSKLPLTLWFWAADLMATHSNGISALQLQRQLGLGSYKSAWLLCAKLRRSMVARGRNPLAGLVEVEDGGAGPGRIREAVLEFNQGAGKVGHDELPMWLMFIVCSNISPASPLQHFISPDAEG